MSNLSGVTLDLKLIRASRDFVCAGLHERGLNHLPVDSALRPPGAFVVVLKENAPENVGVAGELVVDRRAR